MRNNPSYIQLVSQTIDHTDQQIVDATKQQAETLLGVMMSDNFFANAKVCILLDRAEVAFEGNFNDVKDQLISGGRTWLQDNFPDVEFEKGNIEGKRFVTVWLDGKSVKELPNG